VTDIFLCATPVTLVDIWLRDPLTPCVVAIVTLPPRDDKPRHYDRHIRPTPKLRREQREPVVALSLMESLVSQYGVIHGREVYAAMEAELKGPFAPGAKYDATKRQPPAFKVEPPPPARKS
jgi:hypothetical protein